MRKNIVFWRLSVRFAFCCSPPSAHLTSTSVEAIFLRVSFRFPGTLFFAAHRHVVMSLHRCTLYATRLTAPPQANLWNGTKKNEENGAMTEATEEDAKIVHRAQWKKIVIMRGIKGEGERYFQRNWLLHHSLGVSLLMSSTKMRSWVRSPREFCLWRSFGWKCIAQRCLFAKCEWICRRRKKMCEWYGRRHRINERKDDDLETDGFFSFFCSAHDEWIALVFLCKAIFFLHAILRQYISTV